MALTRSRILPALAVAIALALVAVAVAANRLNATSWEARPQAASQAAVGAALATSAERPKERMRYQAIIENWRRYRAETAAEPR